MVSIPLQHRNQSLGSPTQSYMQDYYWVPLFHFLLPTSSWGPTPSSKANSRTSGLFSFERALRLPPDFSSLYALATRNVPCRLKKKPSWRSFCSSATQPLPSPSETLIMCPPFSPWTATHFTVSPFISDCTGNSTAWFQSASSRLFSLPPSDIQLWTDGSVPSLFGLGGAGVYVTCTKCNTFNSLSFCTGPIASSFTAETFALKQGLDWCTSHLITCKFQSLLFLTDSQPALSILLSAPAYLLPESLWNVWSLASFLSNNTTLSFQWVLGHAGLPGNEKADLLAKAIASLPTDAIPCPLSPVVAKVRSSQYHNWRSHISHSYLNFQVPGFPVFAAMATVFFYPYILTGSVGRRILLVVPVNTLYRTSIISSSTVLPLNLFVNLSLAILSLFLTHDPDLGVWPDCWVSAEFLRTLIPRKGSGSTTTTITTIESSNPTYILK